MYRSKLVFLSIVLLLTMVAVGCGPQPTPSPVPTTVPAVKLGPAQRVEEGGFSFQPIPGYEVETLWGDVFMAAPDADLLAGPIVVLSTSAVTSAATLEEALVQARAEFAEFEPSEPRDVTIGGVPGKEFDVTGTEEGVEIFARIAVVKPATDRDFVMAAMCPAERWAGEIEPLYSAVRGSIQFFTPIIPTVSAPATLPPPPTAKAGEYRQWATGAAASSEYGETGWAAIQAIGAPNVVDCGDDTKAWASLESDTEEWLEVSFDVPVYATQVNIYQTYSPDQVVKVELIDTSATDHEVYAGQPSEQACPYILTIAVPKTDYLVDGVRITIDQSVLTLGWNEIDAVELVGVPEGPVPTPGDG